MNWKRYIAILSVSTALVLPEALAAEKGTAKLAVSAVVQPNCRLTVEPLAFGSYDPLGRHASSTSSLDANVSMILTCTRDSRASVVMDSGRNGAGRARSLSFDGSRLQYEIFRDAARTQNWGAGTDAFQILAQGLRTPSELIVYGRIPGGQEVSAGSYTDVITATVDF